MAPRRDVKKKKIGLITEGDGEVEAINSLLGQIQQLCAASVLRPMHVAVDPQAPISLLCRRVGERVKFTRSRGASVTIVVLDSETRQTCPGVRASEIARGLAKLGYNDVRVVLKHTCFENWLISDPAAFRSQPKLFPNHQLIRYPEGMADEIEAKSLIERAMGSARSYSKGLHPRKILEKANIATMQKHSSSFDKFVRAIVSH